jgi:IclR family transcriptional regulator, acetate operon repressor
MDNSDGSGAGGAAAGSATAVQSVDRAVTILEVLARRGETGVSELAAELGVHKSTAFRLLNVLVARGLVEQPAERSKYRLGFGMIRLAGATAARLDLTGQSRPVSERLAAAIGETVNVAVPDDGVTVNIDQVVGASVISSHNWVGQRTPSHATSSGKVLLAFRADQREPVLAQPLASYTPRTVTDPAVLRVQLGEATARGYACTVEELEIGLNAVAAPIRGHSRQVVAAISVSGPSYRLTEERLHAIAPQVVSHAAEISFRLGFVE